MADRGDTDILVGPGIQVRSRLSESQIEHFWTAVLETLRRVFGFFNPQPKVDELRRRLAEAGDETRLFFYHSSPLQVSADLLGVSNDDISDEKLVIYSKIVDDFAGLTYLDGGDKGR